jgi:hypothetical protein
MFTDLLEQRCLKGSPPQPLINLPFFDLLKVKNGRLSRGASIGVPKVCMEVGTARLGLWERLFYREATRSFGL